MVKKLQKISDDKKAAPQLASAVKDSAQQIWLAGLGAFSKAQEEGSKVFDTLVKEGLSIQRKTQAAAEEKITEATSKMSGMASDIQSKAGNRWDKLENIFEERVAKALGKLGVPSARDVSALAERVDQLDKHIQTLNGRAAAARAPARPAAKTAVKTRTPQAAPPAAKKAARPAVKRAAKKVAGPATDTAQGTAE
ncbi:phasin family protein [Polaromonas naphthalenivorans]|uniref:Poly(Hydroxyalkanoate) granule-associated protein n=1 Tax=Polaromonas naphthalenivorans (strain CJ2) TaxID=365044 RepID=A1VT14_POLNA|nr:phasin family protein [Polaromonas naphthalenivorans]ABM38792.1 poly(hydroxyalkanoate) granule-associated protein [Polaromonas naphthalenivorans CJ2]